MRWPSGLLQAAGSWSLDACCAVPGNNCCRGESGAPCYGDTYCHDRASSSDWLFGLWPGPPQRFEPGTHDLYPRVKAFWWPDWGNDDLAIGGSGAPGGSFPSQCPQVNAYRGTDSEICGGTHNWGATDVEVWYLR